MRITGVESRLPEAKACCRQQVFYDKFLYEKFYLLIKFLYEKFYLLICMDNFVNFYCDMYTRSKASMPSFEQVHFIHSHRKSRKKI